MMCRFGRAYAAVALALFAVGCNQSERLKQQARRAAVAPSSTPRALAASSVASATSAKLNGVYSSVRYVEEAGDVLGMEIEVRTTSQPIAVVTICEGQCRGGKVWPIAVDGHQLRFSVTEKLVDQNGNPAASQTLKFVGRLESDILVLRISDAPDVPEERLKRVPNPVPGQTARLGCNATAC
jgi:hypothetical protein